MSRNKVLGIAMIVCAVVLAAAVITSVSGGIGYRYENAGKYTAGGGTVEGTVRNLDVDWIDGKVTISYHSAPTVLISETSKKAISGNMQLRWWLDGETLRVRYAKTGSLRLNWNLDKELTLTLPEGTVMQDVALSATSGSLNIPAMKADSLKMHVTSGEIRAAVSAAKVDSQMTSGDMDLDISGTVKEVTAYATSGNIRINAEETEKMDAGVTSGLVQVKADRACDFKAGATSGNLDVDIADAGSAVLKGTSAGITVRLGKLDKLEVGATSGDVKAFLPAEPGFKAHVTTTSGRFDYGMNLTKQGNDYICGDGSAEVNINVTSGNVRIEEVSK